VDRNRARRSLSWSVNKDVRPNVYAFHCPVVAVA
jgi:hypothetical protein